MSFTATILGNSSQTYSHGLGTQTILIAGWYKPSTGPGAGQIHHYGSGTVGDLLEAQEDSPIAIHIVDDNNVNIVNLRPDSVDVNLTAIFTGGALTNCAKIAAVLPAATCEAERPAIGTINIHDHLTDWGVPLDHIVVDGNIITIGDGTTTKTFEFDVSERAYAKIDFAGALQTQLDQGYVISLTDQNDLTKTFEFRYDGGSVTPGNIWVNTSSDDVVSIVELFKNAINASGLDITAFHVYSDTPAGPDPTFGAVWLQANATGPTGNKPITSDWPWDGYNSAQVMSEMRGGSNSGTVTPGNVQVIVEMGASPLEVISALREAIIGSGLNVTVSQPHHEGGSAINITNNTPGAAGNVTITSNFGILPNPGGKAMFIGDTIEHYLFLDIWTGPIKPGQVPAANITGMSGGGSGGVSAPGIVDWYHGLGDGCPQLTTQVESVELQTTPGYYYEGCVGGLLIFQADQTTLGDAVLSLEPGIHPQTGGFIARALDNNNIRFLNYICCPRLMCASALACIPAPVTGIQIKTVILSRNASDGDSEEEVTFGFVPHWIIMHAVDDADNTRFSIGTSTTDDEFTTSNRRQGDDGTPGPSLGFLAPIYVASYGGDGHEGNIISGGTDPILITWTKLGAGKNITVVMTGIRWG